MQHYKLHLYDPETETYRLVDDQVAPECAAIMLQRANALDAAIRVIMERVEASDQTARALWASGYSFSEVARRLGLDAGTPSAAVVALTAGRRKGQDASQSAARAQYLRGSERGATRGAGYALSGVCGPQEAITS